MQKLRSVHLFAAGCSSLARTCWMLEHSHHRFIASCEIKYAVHNRRSRLQRAPTWHPSWVSLQLLEHHPLQCPQRRDLQLLGPARGLRVDRKHAQRLLEIRTTALRPIRALLDSAAALIAQHPGRDNSLPHEARGCTLGTKKHTPPRQGGANCSLGFQGTPYTIG